METMNLNFSATLILFGLLQSGIMIFLIVKNRKWTLIQNKLLLALLLVMGSSLVPTFLGHSGFIERYDSLRFIPLHLVIFIFPILYLYFKSLFDTTFRLNRQNRFHLLVPVLFWGYSLFIWLGSLWGVPERKGDWILKMGYFEVQLAQHIALLLLACIYSLISFVQLRKKKVLNKQHQYVQWITYLLVFFFMGAAFELVSALLGKIYGYWKSSPLDLWLGFSLTMIVKVYNAVILYIISLMGYLAYSTFKKESGIVDENVLHEKLQEILGKMEAEKPFLNFDFSLATFSKQLQTNPSALSNLLNHHLNTSFNDFANKYRVQEVKDKLKEGAHHTLTLESIARESGFKSKTTFYRAFHKHTSQTPKAYLDQLKKNKKVS
ncbi:helix-turn-helix domain-containing protein [Spongiimicrobium salis]|uniref:helix-turn-helix domain-containing protein n=1 Tax=Spongiimicrobium salis TaxID=1667022 RepID=UPI00374CD11E